MNPTRFSRIFDVLDLLVGHAGGMRLTEISQELGTPLSSTHNLLQTMVAAEVLVVNDDLHYLVGPRAMRLGVRISDSLEVRSAARRHLEKLARAIGNDVYLAVKVGEDVVYVDRFASSQPVSVNIRLGESRALHASAVGKLFSAHEPTLRKRVLSRALPRLTDSTVTDVDELSREFMRIRADGFSVSNEEAYEGVVGFAVPVHDASGSLVAAVHVSAFRAGLAPEKDQRVIHQARAVARVIEMDLGRLDPGLAPVNRIANAGG
jgi:IclR family acetate operon transcriptional repressor